MAHPSDPLLPVRPCLLRAPQCPQVVPLAGDMSYSNHNMNRCGLTPGKQGIRPFIPLERFKLKPGELPSHLRVGLKKARERAKPWSPGLKFQKGSMAGETAVTISTFVGKSRLFGNGRAQQEL